MECRTIVSFSRVQMFCFLESYNTPGLAHIYFNDDFIEIILDYLLIEITHLFFKYKFL